MGNISTRDNKTGRFLLTLQSFLKLYSCDNKFDLVVDNYITIFILFAFTINYALLKLCFT